MTPRLAHRIDLYYASGVWAEVEPDEQAAMRERLLHAVTYESLSDDDRTRLQQGALAASAGRTSGIVLSSSGDFAAIDEALDGDDEAAVEAALDTVGQGDYGYGPAPLSDDPGPMGEDDPVDDDDVEVKADDDGTWVGL